MHTLAPASSVQVLELLQDERKELLRLLGELSPQEWDAATECPAWSVKGIALHLLGDDVSLLSRQRDEEPPGIMVEAKGDGWEDLMTSLDRFNEQWVDTAGFFSPALILDLLRITGEWTHRWYASVDSDRLGETIHWISPIDPQPYWLLAAREYLERWIHHLQIRRAVNSAGLDGARYVIPAVAITLRGFPRALRGLPASPETTVTFTIRDADVSWTLQSAADSWELHDGAPAEPNVRLSLGVQSAANLFSRGLPRSQVQQHLQIEGHTELGQMLVAGLAAFFGRDD
jgi:uncharacterized protein (TIGR03083 family)